MIDILNLVVNICSFLGILYSIFLYLRNDCTSKITENLHKTELTDTQKIDHIHKHIDIINEKITELKYTRLSDADTGNR